MQHTIHRLRAYVITLAAILGLGAAGLITAGAASAAPAPGGPVMNSPTVACLAEFGIFCQEPVVAQAIPSSHNLIPGDDAAMTATGPGGLVRSNIDNDLQDGSQDFAFVPLGRVPYHGHGAFGFTPFDNLIYHGDYVYALEWTPFGQDSGWCDQVTVVNRVRLQPCDGGADQAFITDTGLIPLVGTTPPGYVRVLSVLHNVSLAHHNCLTAPFPVLGAPLTLARCTHVSEFPTLHGGPQFWDSIQ